MSRAAKQRARDAKASGTAWQAERSDAECLEAYRRSGLSDTVVVKHLLRMRPPKLEDACDWDAYYHFRLQHDEQTTRKKRAEERGTAQTRQQRNSCGLQARASETQYVSEAASDGTALTSHGVQAFADAQTSSFAGTCKRYDVRYIPI